MTRDKFYFTEIMYFVLNLCFWISNRNIQIFLTRVCESLNHNNKKIMLTTELIIMVMVKKKTKKNNQ